MQSQNQFAQKSEQGQLDLRYNPGVFAAQVDSTQVLPLTPGQPVTLVDSAGGIPKVIAAATDAANIYGFVVWNVKKSSFAAGDTIEIAGMNDNVMYMTASAAIARGAEIGVVIASKKVLTATATDRIVGYAFDKAAADGDLIRVRVLLPGPIKA